MTQLQELSHSQQDGVALFRQEVTGAAYAAISILERVVRGLDSRKKTVDKPSQSKTGRHHRRATPLISVQVWGSAHRYDGPAPAAAWTDGQDIWIASDTFVKTNDIIDEAYLSWDSRGSIGNISPLKFIDFSVLRGAVYHELSHILYTGRAETYTRTKISEGRESSWNLLEDHRVETLFASRFSGASAHFVKTVYEVVLNHAKANWEYSDRGEEELPKDSLHYLWGRKYLPLETRTEAFRIFAEAYGYELAKESCELIDAFVFAPQRAHTAALQPKSAQRKDEIDELDRIVTRFNEIRKEIHCTTWLGETSHAHKRMIAGRPSKDSPVSGEIVSEIPDPTVEQSPQQNDAVEDQGTGDNSEPENNSGSLPHQIKNQIEQASKDIAAEANAFKKATYDELYKATTIKSGVYKVSPISLQARFCEGDIRRSLSRVTDRLASGVDKRKRNGRINPARWEREKNLENAFDSWRPSATRTAEADIMVLADTSGSMAGSETKVCEVAWAVKSAVEGLGVGKVGVLSFDNNARWLYKLQDKVSRSEFRYTHAHGGTQPTEAFTEAVKILSKSLAPSKLLVILTDGHFSNKWVTRQVAKAKLEGITVLAVFYAPNRSDGSYTEAIANKVKGKYFSDPDSLSDSEIVLWDETVQNNISRNVRGESSEYNFGAEYLDRAHKFDLTFTCYSPKGFAKVIERTLESMRDKAVTGAESQWIRSRRRAMSSTGNF